MNYKTGKLNRCKKTIDINTDTQYSECLYSNNTYALSNKLAFISLIFGFLFIFQFYDFHIFKLHMRYDLFYIICGILGIVSGSIALYRIKKVNTKNYVKSIAAIGIITSIILLIEIPVITYIIADTHTKNNSMHCLNNQRKIAQLIIMYVQDHE